MQNSGGRPKNENFVLNNSKGYRLVIVVQNMDENDKLRGNLLNVDFRTRISDYL